MAIPEVPISADLKLAKTFLKRTKLLWNIAIYTIPLDLLAFTLVYANDDKAQANYLLLWVVSVVAILSANHNWVLKLILFSKKVKRFVYQYHKQIALGLFGCVVLYAVALALGSIFSADFQILTYVINSVSYLVSVLSIAYVLLKLKSKSVSEEENIIPLERIYYICVGRVFIPRLLSFWAAFLAVLQVISKTDFVCFALLGVAILLNARPSLENFISKCRSCGKEVLYGAGKNGYCQECVPMLTFKSQKFVLPKKMNPHQVKDKQSKLDQQLQALKQQGQKAKVLAKEVADKIKSKLPLRNPKSEDTKSVDFQEDEVCPK